MTITNAFKALGTWRQRGLLAILLALSPVVIFSATANATIDTNCPAARFCAFTDANGGGTRATWAVEPAHTCLNVPPSMNNVISSLKNNLNQEVSAFDDANCTGISKEDLYPTDGISNLADIFYHDNDAISSFRFN